MIVGLLPRVSELYTVYFGDFVHSLFTFPFRDTQLLLPKRLSPNRTSEHCYCRLFIFPLLILLRPRLQNFESDPPNYKVRRDSPSTPTKANDVHPVKGWLERPYRQHVYLILPGHLLTFSDLLQSGHHTAPKHIQYVRIPEDVSLMVQNRSTDRN